MVHTWRRRQHACRTRLLLLLLEVLVLRQLLLHLHLLVRRVLLLLLRRE